MAVFKGLRLSHVLLHYKEHYIATFCINNANSSNIDVIFDVHAAKGDLYNDK